MADYTISPARYAKGQMLVRCPSTNGLKSRAACVAEALKGRYTHREHGYILSPTKAKRFEQLLRDGWNASYFGELTPPKQESAHV